MSNSATDPLAIARPMRPGPLAASLLTAMLVGAGPACAVPFEIVPITDNAIADFNPVVSGSTIAWTALTDPQDEEGTSAEVFIYRDGAIRRLTHDSFRDDQLRISGRNLAWVSSQTPGSEGDEIKTFDGSRVRQLTHNDAFDTEPDISGRKVVWTRTKPPDFQSEVHLFDGRTKRRLTNNDVFDAGPQISGSNVVWRSAGDQLLLFDGRTTRPIGTGLEPRLSGSNAVWYDFDGHDYEIFFFNGRSVRQITKNETNDFLPRVSGTNIAWLGTDSAGFTVGDEQTDVFFLNVLDGLDPVRVTNDDVSEFGHRISGSNLVWVARNGGDFDVFLFDGRHTVNLTRKDPADDLSPDIFGPAITWTSGSGLESEIYVACARRGPKRERSEFCDYRWQDPAPLLASAPPAALQADASLIAVAEPGAFALLLSGLALTAAMSSSRRRQGGSDG